VDGDTARWREIGFRLPEPTSRYAFLELSLAHSEVVATDEQGHTFKVLTRQ
jgi:hypothetical protein